MTQAPPLDYLFSLEQHGIKLGLDNIGTLCAALDHPEQTFQSIIVAGTNGKGSVAATIDTALRASGLTTGRFTSPHLIDLEERFCVNGSQISRVALSELAAQLQEITGVLQKTGQLDAPPTFFEATTALAFMLFQRSGVDVAVLEVGMGGQFDATNIITPIAAVITTVDLDHQQFLGHTVPEIAFEKAGVIKPGILVVSGETKPDAQEVVRRVCQERDARLVEAPFDVMTKVTVEGGVTELQLTTPHASYGPLRLALRGRHQVANACTAVRLLEELKIVTPVSVAAIESALTTTHWPGRLELLEASDHHWVLLDAAHNTAAAAALGSYLAETYPKGLPLVFAAMRDKDIGSIIGALAPHVTRVVCCPLTHQRAWPSSELALAVVATCPDMPTTVADSPLAALETAWRDGAIACAAGSAYLVGELLHLLAPQTQTSSTSARRPR